jgi:hypothetical protein
MEIKQKELGQDIIVHFDYKNNKRFLDEVKRLANEYEHKSNYKKLNYSVLFNCRKRPLEMVNGWTSRVITEKEGIMEIVFLDYDNILYSLVKAELLFLQKKYNLSPFYVFKSFETEDKQKNPYGNYMAISIAKKPFGKVYEILSKTHADSSYKVVPASYPYKTWVLRLGKKFKKKAPEFKEIIGDLKKEYEMSCSQAHLKILEQLYPNIKNKIKYTNLDKGTEVFLSNYLTASK